LCGIALLPAITTDVTVEWSVRRTGQTNRQTDGRARLVLRPIRQPHNKADSAKENIRICRCTQTITVSVATDMTMLRGNSDAATVTVEIWSIGVFDAQRNVQYTKDVFQLLTETLQLPPDR